MPGTWWLRLHLNNLAQHDECKAYPQDYKNWSPLDVISSCTTKVIRETNASKLADMTINFNGGNLLPWHCLRKLIAWAPLSLYSRVPSLLCEFLKVFNLAFCTFLSKPSNTSVWSLWTVLLWASSTIMTEYLER